MPSVQGHIDVPYGYTKTYAEKDKYDVKKPVEQEREIRIALIGLGGIAIAKHAPAIRRLKDTGSNIRIAAGADPDTIVRDKVSRNHGFPCFASADELLRQVEVDAVLALTDPGDSRFDVISKAIDRGIHIFTEKPFLYFGADRLREAITKSRALVAAAEKKKLIVMTGLVKQFSPPYQVAQKLISGGEIGDISMIAIKMCQGWSRHILLEGQACHILHIARRFGGEIKRLTAFGVNRFAEPNYPLDNIAVNVEFESGAIGAFCFNSSSPSLKPWERVEVFGERRWLEVDDGATVTLHSPDGEPSKRWAPVMPHTLMFDEEFGGFVGELRNFVAAIRGREPIAISGHDGIAALVLAAMIHASIAENRVVARSEWIE